MSPPAFETILPEIESRSRRHYSRLRGGAQDDAVQESVCQAFALYDSAVRRGNFRFTPATLTVFANRAVDSGRKFAGYTTTDALDKDRAISFEALDADGHSRIAEALIQRQTPVFDQARIRIDWPEFLDLGLTERERDATTKLAEGWKRTEIASYLGLSPARVTQIFDKVTADYEAHFGVPGFEMRARSRTRRKPGRQSKRARAA